jgi:hypothetical protein
MDGRPRHLPRCALLAPEEPPRAHHQHNGHDEEDEDERDFRQDQNAEGVKLGNDHGGEKCAGDAAEPADHHDHEHFDDDPQVHVVACGLARQLQRSAQRGKKNAERKHAGEQPFLIDAERGDHVAVLRRGADEDAPAGAMEEKPQNGEHRGAEGDQEQFVARHCLPENLHRAFEPGRARPDQIDRPPN